MPSLHHIVCLSPLAGLRWVRGTDKEEIVKLPRDLDYDIIIRPPWPIQISLRHTEQLALLAHYYIPVPLTWVVSGWASCVKWLCQCVGLMVIPDFDTKPAAVGAHRKRSFGNAQCIDFLWLGEINYWKKIPWVLLLLVLLTMCKRGAFTVDGKNTQFTLWRVLSCLKNPFSFKQIRMTVNHKKLYTEQKEWIFFSTSNQITEY